MSKKTLKPKLKQKALKPKLKQKTLKPEIEAEDESPIGMYINLDNTR
jgi:hypothetical protein